MNFNKLNFFASFWKISRIATERLRILLIHIFKYFPTLEIMEKTKKRSPTRRMSVRRTSALTSHPLFALQLYTMYQYQHDILPLYCELNVSVSDLCLCVNIRILNRFLVLVCLVFFFWSFFHDTAACCCTWYLQ